MKNFVIRKNLFDRWIVCHPSNPYLAWSGSQWVGVDFAGLPTDGIEVSNLSTESKAVEYAKKA